MNGFIDDHGHANAVEPICRVPPLAPSPCHAHAARRANPGQAPAPRTRRGMGLRPAIRRIFEGNFRVDGVCARTGGDSTEKKLLAVARWPHRRTPDAGDGSAEHRAAGRPSGPRRSAMRLHRVCSTGRCTVASRRRGRTRSRGRWRHPPLRGRIGRGPWIPNRTHVSTWHGFVQVVIVIDARARRIVGSSRVTHGPALERGALERLRRPGAGASRAPPRPRRRVLPSR